MSTSTIKYVEWFFYKYSVDMKLLEKGWFFIFQKYQELLFPYYYYDNEYT